MSSLQTEVFARNFSDTVVRKSEDHKVSSLWSPHSVCYKRVPVLPVPYLQQPTHTETRNTLPMTGNKCLPFILDNNRDVSVRVVGVFDPKVLPSVCACTRFCLGSWSNVPQLRFCLSVTGGRARNKPLKAEMKMSDRQIGFPRTSNKFAQRA